MMSIAGSRTCCAAAGVAVLMAGCGPAEEPPPDLIYDQEYPQIGYAQRAPGGRLGQFAAAVADGSVMLEAHPGRAYLDELLDQLEIDVSSQALVYSRTSVLTRFISPATPRAIYFNDDTYVAFTPDAPAMEISGFDPALGPVFYTLSREGDPDPVPEREFGVCLRCHDTYGMSGGGVPRFLLGSGYTGADGELVSHEAWILTDQSTPLRNRWGGWYVTGKHGSQVNLGNIVVEKAEDLQDLESLRVGNIDNLNGLFDTTRYLAPYSDIVALMVLEHQVEVQNLISRLRFEAAANKPIEEHVQALADAMLMRDAIALSDPITGSSGFTEYFESLGPSDSSGRSLRQLDLESRLFTYQLSYQIYSLPFQALPGHVKEAVYRRLDDGMDDLAEDERRAIREILRETLPEAVVDRGQ